MAKSNQRITKIKRDPIEQLLRRAEATDVKDGTTIMPAGFDLTPYPDYNQIHTWTRDYLLRGVTGVYINDLKLNGDATLTTLIDGLVLNTSFTKPMDTTSAWTEWTQPELSSNGTMGYESFAVSCSSYSGQGTDDSGNAWHATCLRPSTSTETYRWQSSSSETLPQTITYYTPVSTKLKQLSFVNQNITSDLRGNLVKTFELHASNDNETWTLLKAFTNTHIDIDEQYYFTVDTELPFKYYRVTVISNQQDSGPCIIGYMQLVADYLDENTALVTSKPGLWLSNLLATHSESGAGSWLRQNLIPEEAYTNNLQYLNTSIIGNYANTFIQPGIIHRTAGSEHYDSDSYCMLWSPSADSCMSHDSIVIPTTNLRNTYTFYSTYCVPENPNAQTYTWGDTKDVKFTFVANNSNHPLSLDEFNGRIVGKDWSFELLFEPNKNGSGTWGNDCDCDTEVDCDTCPHCYQCASEDVRSNGGCITGTITYQNDDGTVCQQSINQCFQSTQAAANPNNPNTSTPTIESKKQIYTASANGVLMCGCGYPCATFLVAPPSWQNILNNRTRIKSFSFSSSPVESGRQCTTKKPSVPKSNGFYYFEYFEGRGNCACSPLMGISGEDEWTHADCSGDCWTGSIHSYYHLTVTAYGPDLDVDGDTSEDSVNIYFNLTDLRAQYEKQGLPWNYTCSEMKRFTYDISTSPCTDVGCKSYLIAENVSISSLGDIVGLTTKTIKG